MCFWDSSLSNAYSTLSHRIIEIAMVNLNFFIFYQSAVLAIHFFYIIIENKQYNYKFSKRGNKMRKGKTKIFCLFVSVIILLNIYPHINKQKSYIIQESIYVIADMRKLNCRLFQVLQNHTNFFRRHFSVFFHKFFLFHCF